KSISMYDYKFNSNTALVFGHEITGIDEGIVKQSDATVHIPMYGKKKSLNIATSVGIGTYFYKSVQK
ncbi:TrmH family RNA methyltransferase, partial [Candidatus Dojkabacteria bacterium]|nr:TrmH family RNA methyltransferase [Candidatus Dojkabacteria bacterium]